MQPLDPSYLTGYILGFIVAPFVLAYIICWVWSKFKKNTHVPLKRVIVIGLILLILSGISKLSKI